MNITVMLFGRLADIAGKATIHLHDITDTDSLNFQMHHLYPELEELKYLIAVDKQVIKENIRLRDNMTVALLPPFSGG